MAFHTALLALSILGLLAASLRMPPVLVELIATSLRGHLVIPFFMYWRNSSGWSRMLNLSTLVYHLACSPCGHFSYMGRRLFCRTVGCIPGWEA